MRATLRHLTILLLGALLLAFAVAGPAAAPAAATPAGDKARYDRIQEQLAETRAAIDAARARESALGAEVADFDARLVGAQ